MTIAKRIQLVLVLITLFLLLIPSIRGNANEGPAIDHAGGYENLIEVVLRADGVPSPGGMATLSFEATPLIDAPDLEIHWVVAPGAVLLGSSTDTPGAVAAHQMVSSQRQIQFPTNGTYKVAVDASFSPAKGMNFGASGVLFFTIQGNGSRVSDKDPDARSPMHSIMPTQVTTSPNLSGPTPVPSNGDPCFIVQGNIRRIDRPPTPTGFGPDQIIAVHNALVEIREEDILFDDSYGEVFTDSSGNFSHIFCDDDGWFDDELEVYIRLHAEIYSGGTFVAEVIDTSWIDETYEYDSGVAASEGGTLTFNMNLTENQSAVFNIADAVLDAWTVWADSGGESGGDSVFAEEGEVHWEPGYGETKSYYISFWEEITIADDPSNPDQWDDSVIIHEWGHMADDIYSCDDSPGGPHFLNRLVGDTELAWGEGYPDYGQSAVRAAVGDPFGNFYLDISGSGSPGISVNLETTPTSGLVSVLYEFAIASALWDLNDGANDGLDTISLGHPMIQDVYTSDTFESVADGFFDDDCDFDTFMRAWGRAGKPTDAATAAAVLQNTGYTLPPSPPSIPTTQVLSRVGTDQFAFGPTDGIWWNQVTYVVDNSASMAGPKFDAVKTALEEGVNDLATEPEGTEFTLETFNNTSSINQQVFAGQFFPADLTPAINDLSTSTGGDGTCQVDAFNALVQAADDQFGGDTWLFTDGDTNAFLSVENMKQILNTRNVRASIALLGLCPPASSTNLTEQEQQHLRGAAEAYLGLAADETPGGLVPYLLTAINSGGQFLFVDSTQVADAADILRAQITHSAGAGRWSDYVSDQATYRWDNLASWEYDWIDAMTGGTNHGRPTYNGFVDVTLPQPFTYYDAGPYTIAHVYENGFLTLGPHFADEVFNFNNATLPHPAIPNNAIYPFWDDLDWSLLVSPLSTADGFIYSKQEGDWFAIEHFNFFAAGTPPHSFNTIEVLLNSVTSEIRFQYEVLPDGAGGATIGIEDTAGTNGVQVSYNDINGASSGMGYKFTPAPPQPSKTYEVAVDSMMQGVGFLLTGYSGSFETLAVYYPDGAQVDCADTANVLCLDLGLVQYVQADVDDRYGVWNAVVDAGPTGSGTFSFISMAASALSVESRGDHSLSTIGGGPIFVDLGQSVDGNILEGWFRQPNDNPFGGTFTLYDDGAHSDGFSGDGLFGSDPYEPPGAGTAYLWIAGLFNSASFIRSDPVPYTFQPVGITSLGDGANFGGATELEFELKNNDVHDHCYLYSYQAPEGWRLEGLGLFFPIVCLDDGETFIKTVDAYMGPGFTNDLPSGTTGEFTLTILELEEGIMSDTASAQVTRHRPPASILIHNPTFYLRPNGDTTTLEFMVFDDQGVVVADGTKVDLSATLGTITPATGITAGGAFTATFTSGATQGTSVITAMAAMGVSETTNIDIGTPKANLIALSVTPGGLPADGTSTAILVATVHDRYGTPMANQDVRIGLEEDGQFGTINGGEVITGTTDASGQFSAVFTASTIPGDVGVRAELLVRDDGSFRVVHEDRKVIVIGILIYLPLILR